MMTQGRLVCQRKKRCSLAQLEFMNKLLTLGNFSSRSGILVTPVSEPISDEIRRLAIIPRSQLFNSGSKVINNYIKWDVMHWIKARLEGLSVI